MGQTSHFEPRLTHLDKTNIRPLLQFSYLRKSDRSSYPLKTEVELDITPKLKKELKKAIKETGDSSFYFYMIGSNDVLLTPDEDVDKGGLDIVAI